MTILKLPLDHARDARISMMFFRKTMNTAEIAHALNVRESDVWNRMDVARKIWTDWMLNNE